MKILLFGKNGQVGWELSRSLQPLGEVIALDRKEADFSQPECLRQVVQEHKPDVIVNAVGYTAVDKAEQEEELATLINGVAPGVLAEEAKQAGALLVHYSTDYVFDGEKSSAYTESDAPRPINAYGRSKLAGEQAIQSSGCDYLIFRTSWVYAARGHNFLLTILSLAKEREELSIVADQVGSPTQARLIAETTLLCLRQSLMERHMYDFISDLYHLTASGFVSWHGFASEIVSVVNGKSGKKSKVKNINEIMTADYPVQAKRPKNSKLMLTKLEEKFGLVMPDWRKSLEQSVEEII